MMATQGGIESKVPSKARNRRTPKSALVDTGPHPPTNILSSDIKYLYEEQQSSAGPIFHLQIQKNMILATPLKSRVQSKVTSKLMQYFSEAFLPHGYPNSVSKDYAEYQMWDTIQAFCSTLTGALTTHAMMKGMGVGNTSATALGAAITWMLRDGTGMAGRIIFGWWKGFEFDKKCKQWRLFADVLNDVAMFIELLLPYMSMSGMILCISTGFKSLVGVAGGATRAALTQHQAIRGNMADVSAKDGSQESCVNLIASLCGILVLMWLGDSAYVWILFTIFTGGHLYANYKAVRAVQMNTLNSERFFLLLRTYVISSKIANVKKINRLESVVLGQEIKVHKFCGFSIKLGTSIRTSGLRLAQKLEYIMKLSEGLHYMPYVDLPTQTINIFFRKDAQDIHMIAGYYHAILLAFAMSMVQFVNLPLIDLRNLGAPDSPMNYLARELVESDGDFDDPILKAYETAGDLFRHDFDKLIQKLDRKGWNTAVSHLSVGSWRGNWVAL